MLARLSPAIFGLCMVALGLMFVMNPGSVQAYLLRYEKDTWLSRLNPFRGWMLTEGYLHYVRWMGAFMILFGTALVALAVCAK